MCEACREEEVEDEELCEKCIKDGYVVCGECDDVTKDYETDSKGDIYCRPCYDDKYAICDKCGTEINYNDRCLSDNGDVYCDDCYGESYTSCDDCDSEVHRDDARYVNDRCVCEGCYDCNYFYCEICGHDFHNDDYGEDGRCSGCADERDDDKPYIESVPATEDEVAEMVDILLNAKPTRRRFCRVKYNSKDNGLSGIVPRIRSHVPLYLYGLINREEYQMTYSKDLEQYLVPHAVKPEFDGLLIQSPMGWITAIPASPDRISGSTMGFCRELRDKHPEWIADFLNKITDMRCLQEAA